MAHRPERYDRHFVCDDYRHDSSVGYGRLSALSVKGHWWGARIYFDRRADLLARSFEGKIGFVCEPALVDGLAIRCYRTCGPTVTD